MAINKKSIVIPTVILLLTLIMSGKLNTYAGDNKLDKKIHRNISYIGVMTHLTVADGLSSDIVRCIYRDSHNLLWIGTSSGLNRWDGHEMKTYTSDQLSLPLHSGFVSTIQEDAMNNLWLEWDNQNLIYLRDLDSIIPLSEYIDGPQPNIHYNIFIDSHKNIWMLDPHGELSLLNSSGKLKGKNKIFRGFGDRLSWVEHPEGGLVILTGNDGIYRIKPDLKKEKFLSSISDKKTFDENSNIYIDNSGDLWVYNYRDTEFNLYDTSAKEWKTRQLPDSQDSGNCINGFIDNGEGIIWISTDHQGIYLYDKDNDIFVRHLTYNDNIEQPLVSNRVTVMLRDGEGNIWIGYLRDGVTAIHSASIIRPFHDKVVGDVLALLPDETGQLWIGTDGNGLYVRDQNGDTRKWRDVPDVAVMSLSKGHDGKIYACTYDHGIYIIDGKQTTHLSKSKGNCLTDNVWISMVDREGSLWFGSQPDGLFKMLPHGEIRRITLSDGTNVGPICLFNDNSDSIYVGTGKGYMLINIITDQVSEPVTMNKSGTKQFLNNYITNIFKDSDDIIWLGHFEGLTAFDQKTDRIYTITRSEGLVDNTVSDITEDSRRVVWVGTYNGMSAITKHINTDKSIRLSFANHSVSDGLCSNYVSANSFCKLPNNDILIGGVNGYSLLSPGLIKDLPKDRKVVFTSLKIGGKEVKVNSEYDELKIPKAIESLDRLVLNAPVREVSIGFASDDILSNSRMTYAYFIKGLSDEWIVTDKHEISVSQFPAGKYELQIKAMNSNGEWSDSVSNLELIIKHPWYLRWWAVLLYIIIFATAIYLLFLYRIRRIMEKASLRAIEETSERQRKMNEMKLQFFTNVSHDLKTPLTLILSPLQLLLKRKYDDETASHLQIINRNATHLLSLIENLLDFRKLDIGGETLHPIKCEVISALSEVCDNFKAAAALRDIEIMVMSSVKSLYAETDIVKIKKCFYNILSNALKFSPDNSIIKIEFDYSDTLLIIKVSDQGKGVPDKIKKEIFSRFFQGDHCETNPGSGIGLHIVSEYIKMLHGNVEVLDNHPTGSSFVVSIPIIDKGKEIETMSINNSVCESQTEEDPKDESEDSDAMIKTMTVLVVDDNRDLCVFLSDALKNEGYDVVMALDGTEALKELEKNNVGIVVSDVMMPGIDGIELCRRIKTDMRYSHIPVILLTAKSSDEAKLNGLGNGADDYLTKPFNFDILRLRIQKFIELRKEKTERFLKGKELMPSDVTITPIDEQFMKKAVRIVEDYMSDLNFDVETLSSQLGLSRGHLYKKFMGIIGIGPGEFIRSIRIKRGRQLLDKSQMRVSEIAYAVGYNTPKRFSISFKEEYGMTPTEYLNTKKNNGNQGIIQK